MLNQSNNEKIFYDPAAEAIFVDATRLFFDGEVKKAHVRFTELNKRFPKFYPGLVAYGDILLHDNRPELALGPLRQAVKLVAHEGKGFYLLGVAYLQMGRFHHAAQALETANALLSEEERAETLTYLGRAKVMLGELDEGRRLIQEAFKKDITNPFIHMDMAQTYIQVAEYDQALKWCESAQALAPCDQFVRENIKRIKGLRTSFLKIPRVKQELQRKLFQTKKYQEQMRIEFLMATLGHSRGTAEDVAEVAAELKMNGLSGQVTMFRDPKEPKVRAAVSYMKTYEKYCHRNRKITSREYKIFEKILFSPSELSEKKKALVILASQGTRPALKILTRYKKNPDFHLKIWALMAYDGCEAHLEAKEAGGPLVKFHKISS